MPRARRHASRFSAAPILAALLSLALALVGYGHAPLRGLDTMAGGAAGAPAAIDTPAYLLPDGSALTLCLGGAGDASEPDAGSRCENCRLAASIALPEPTLVETTPVLSISAAHWPERRRTARARLLRADSQPRAPPVA